jgi:hypothetical protein
MSVAGDDEEVLLYHDTHFDSRAIEFLHLG